MKSPLFVVTKIILAVLILVSSSFSFYKPHSVAGQIPQPIIVDTIQLDTRIGKPGPAIGKAVLFTGQILSIEVSGTWSAWSAGSWSSFCGQPDASPQTSSPGVTNGKVGADAAYVFAAPRGYYWCEKGDSPPWQNPEPIQFSLDGGKTWSKLPSDIPYQSNHVYTYETMGKGFPLQVLINDSSVPYDNYGILSVNVFSDVLIELTGSIVSPLDRSTVGPTSIYFSANASSIGGNGVKQVEFNIFYDGYWHLIDIDTTSPYSTNWDIPLNPLLQSQILQFRIDVVGNDGTITQEAGGIHWVYYLASWGPSDLVKENWVPIRAYLNQRSLYPCENENNYCQGDNLCSVSSMAMVAAMEEAIGQDYSSMANFAKNTYPLIVGADGTTGPLQMQDKFPTVITATVIDHKSTPEATAVYNWPLLVEEINAKRPVIVGAYGGTINYYGHFIVAVGYWEANDSAHTRYIIAYDPYGRWSGKSCMEIGGCTKSTINYDRNGIDQFSHKGQWVFYDFNKFLGSGVLILARRKDISPQRLYVQSLTPITPPDLTSSESPNYGNYWGAPISDIFWTYIPSLHR